MYIDIQFIYSCIFFALQGSAASETVADTPRVGPSAPLLPPWAGGMDPLLGWGFASQLISRVWDQKIGFRVSQLGHCQKRSLGPAAEGLGMHGVFDTLLVFSLLPSKDEAALQFQGRYAGTAGFLVSASPQLGHSRRGICRWVGRVEPKRK